MILHSARRAFVKGPQKSHHATEHADALDARTLRSTYRELRRSGVSASTARSALIAAYHVGARAEMRRTTPIVEVQP